MIPRWLREAVTVLLGTAGVTVGFVILLFGLPLGVLWILPSGFVSSHCPGAFCLAVLAATMVLAFGITFGCASWLLDQGYLRLLDAW